MNTPKTIHTERAYLNPAVGLARFISRERARQIRRPVTFLLSLLFVIEFTLMLADSMNDSWLALVIQESGVRAFVDPYRGIFLGSMCILAGIWLTFFMIWAFHNHYYFSAYRGTIRESKKKAENRLSYEVADILYDYEHTRDLTTQFLRSPLGWRTLVRCGITKEHAHDFIEHKKTFLSLESLDEVLARENLTYRALAAHVYISDKDFEDFLFKHGVSQEDYHGSSAWIERVLQEWSRK